MSLSNDIHFLRRLNLPRFQDQGNSKFVFRCPVCGDSEVSSIKRRGFAEPHKSKDELHTYCHNCTHSSSFYFFLKTLLEKSKISQEFFDEYQKESLIKKYTKQKEIKLSKDEYDKLFVTKSEFSLKENDCLKCVKNIKCKIVTDYLKERHIQEKYWNNLYVTHNFKELIRKYYVSDKYSTEIDTARIVFSVFDNTELIGLQGRSIDRKFSVRYLTVKLKEESTLCYIPENINLNEQVYLTEGVFDALMLSQGCAMMTSMIDLKYAKEKFKNPVFIFDNEKRNKEISKNYDKIAKLEHFGLFIWPKDVKEKDLNELANRLSFDELEKIVKENSYFGCLNKKIKLANWKS